MSQRRETEDKCAVDAVTASEFLNSLVQLDQEAMQKLADTRVPCNKSLVDHPTVQTSNGHVGLLGIINGLFGTDDRGWGHICAMFDLNNRLIGFCAVDRVVNETPKEKEPSMKKNQQRALQEMFVEKLCKARSAEERLDILRDMAKMRRAEQENERTKRLQAYKKDMTLSELLAEGRRVWGTSKLAPTHIVTCMGVVFGDIARCVRDMPHADTHDELKKEVGNMILSAIRWADDLHMDLTDIISAAIVAQEDKAKKRPMSNSIFPDWGPCDEKCTVTVCEKCGQPYASDIGHISGREICEDCGPRYLSGAISRITSSEQEQK